MDTTEAVRVSGLVRVLVGDRRVCERLHQRPAWVRGLYAQLVRLKDPFPSDIELIPCEELAKVRPESVPLLPRIGRISTSPLHVGQMELTIREDGTPVHHSGPENVVATSADLASQGFGSMPDYPVLPGQVALAVFVPPDASAEEWRERMAECWADIQRIRKVQRIGWREAQTTRTKAFLEDARRELTSTSGSYREWLLNEGIPSLERRLTALARDDVDRHVRIDLPCRDLVWLREFLGAEKKTGDIAADWEDQLSSWHFGKAMPAKDDLLLAAAYEEWRGRRRKALASVDEATVRRSLERWIGDLGAPPRQKRPFHGEPVASRRGARTSRSQGRR